MNAKEFLKQQGINIESTVLISYIDETMRNVDVVKLLEDYVQECRAEDDFNRKWQSEG